MEVKKQILKACMQKGFLLDKGILDSLLFYDESFSIKIIESLLNLKTKERVINKNMIIENKEELLKIFLDINQKEVLNNFFLNINLTPNFKINESKIIKDKKVPIKILSSSIIFPKKVDVQDFVRHFKNRYEQLKNVLQERSLNNLKSIRRIGDERESQSIIVMIIDKKITKNKNLMFEVEDLTGRAKILINNNRQDLFKKCKDILPDEVVAFNVSGKIELLFADDVIFPDLLLQERKKSNSDVNIAFISDIHMGSKMFLEENFLKFINWLNGEEGTEEQKLVAKNIKYLFLVGDNVDGIGVFPDQERFLKIMEMTEQYKKLAEYLKLIRKDINIIISPGQHDAVWVGEPQPVIGEYWAPDFYKMENVNLITNPGLIEIEEGFKVLVYHGASFHGIVENVPHIRINNEHNNPTVILKELLKKRHLAPTHGECDYVPMENKDPLVIDIVPDIIATGDLHKPEVSMYNNILLVASSCWQSKTPFEEKVGNNPDPCKVPVFNLKSREIKIFDFSTPKEEVINEN